MISRPQNKYDVRSYMFPVPRVESPTDTCAEDGSEMVSTETDQDVVLGTLSPDNAGLDSLVFGDPGPCFSLNVPHGDSLASFDLGTMTVDVPYRGTLASFELGTPTVEHSSDSSPGSKGIFGNVRTVTGYRYCSYSENFSFGKFQKALLFSNGILWLDDFYCYVWISTTDI